MYPSQQDDLLLLSPDELARLHAAVVKLNRWLPLMLLLHVEPGFRITMERAHDNTHTKGTTVIAFLLVQFFCQKIISFLKLQMSACILKELTPSY